MTHKTHTSASIFFNQLY